MENTGHERKNDKLDCIKILNVCSANNTARKKTRQATGWGKILANKNVPEGWFHRVVLSTPALHTEGLRFEPQQSHGPDPGCARPRVRRVPRVCAASAWEETARLQRSSS